MIPAYLEGSVIESTITQLQGVLSAYPGKTSIAVIASDAATADAARRASAGRVLETARGGKPAASNLAAETSRADVLIFTDANCKIAPSTWPSEAVEELRRSDLVSGNKNETGSREGLFWKMEQDTKRRFGESAGTISVVGEFLALRRSDYISVPNHVIVDDLWLATRFVQQGKRVTVSDRIHTIEDPVSNREQWGRRTRIAKGLLVEQLPAVRSLMKSVEGRFFVGHKLYRITIGCLGFWLAAVSAVFIYLPWTILLIPTLALIVALYSGAIVPSARLNSIVSAVGMQAVPISGVWSVLSSRRASRSASQVGWEKVER